MEVAVLDLILLPSALTAGLQQPHEYQSQRRRGVTTQAHVFSPRTADGTDRRHVL